MFSTSQIDECERLWVLDTGKLSTFTSNPQQLCPPQIVVYDLKNNYKVICKLSNLGKGQLCPELKKKNILCPGSPTF